MDSVDRRILDKLQDALPLVHRPYEEIARALGLEEADVVRRVLRMREEGTIRRLGPIIDNDTLGRPATLAVASVPPDDVERVGAIVSAHPGVTHNYLRRGKNREVPYNLWFTFSAADDDALAAGLRKMEERIGQPIHSLPARKKFKVGVRFPILRAEDAAEAHDA